jgi:hypothetical protein
MVEGVKGKRNQGREKLRLMHNRSADEKGHHKIKRYENDGKIWCEKCGRSSGVKRISQWPITKCRGPEEEEGKEEEEETKKEEAEEGERTRRERPGKKERAQKRSGRQRLKGYRKGTGQPERKR